MSQQEGVSLNPPQHRQRTAWTKARSIQIFDSKYYVQFHGHWSISSWLAPLGSNVESDRAPIQVQYYYNNIAMIASENYVLPGRFNVKGEQFGPATKLSSLPSCWYVNSRGNETWVDKLNPLWRHFSCKHFLWNIPLLNTTARYVVDVACKCWVWYSLQKIITELYFTGASVFQSLMMDAMTYPCRGLKCLIDSFLILNNSSFRRSWQSWHHFGH